MKHYTDLTQEQLYQIFALLKSKTFQNEITRTVGVSKSTISRELKRNTAKRGYRPKQGRSLPLREKPIILNVLPILVRLISRRF